MSVCCVECFGDESVKQIIQNNGQSGDCDFCGATNATTAEVEVVAGHFEHLLSEYEPVEPWVHYHPATDEANGDTLDFLLSEDYPGLFADRLDSDRRGNLVQEILDEIDWDFDEKAPARNAREQWARRGDDLWSDGDQYIHAPPHQWYSFSRGIRQEWRFVRPVDTEDPASYLTSEVLSRLERTIDRGYILYRAVLDGRRVDGEIKGAHEPARMQGPRPEHCTSGGRLNPPGIAVLYTASDIETVVAEVRPWRGSPVSVATLRVKRALKIVDFTKLRPAPNVDDKAFKDAGVLELIAAIGAEMAEPVAPHAGEIEYVPTQYVAELVRSARYDGIAFRSALGPGENVVLFDRDDVCVHQVELLKVSQVRYEYKILDLDDF
jgi:hypothetical protein